MFISVAYCYKLRTGTRAATIYFLYLFSFLPVFGFSVRSLFVIYSVCFLLLSLYQQF